MKKIYKLNQKLEKLESQKQNSESLENISFFKFIKYKKILSQKKRIGKKLNKMLSLGEKINFWYDSNTKSWIENSKISCRKYYKLERYAAYKKDLKLYKLGLLSKRPRSPLFQDILKITEPIGKEFKFFLQDLKFFFSKKKFPIFNLIRGTCEGVNAFFLNKLSYMSSKRNVKNSIEKKFNQDSHNVLKKDFKQSLRVNVDNIVSNHMKNIQNYNIKVKPNMSNNNNNFRKSVHKKSCDNLELSL